MYIPGDQPEQLDQLLDLYHQSCRALEGLPVSTTTPLLPGQTNDSFVPGQLIRIRDGVLDVIYDSRITLILQPGDVLQIPDLHDWPLQLRSEDSGTLEIIRHDGLKQALADADFAYQYTQLLTCANQALMLAFAASNRHGMRPQAGFRRMRAGSTIVRQGAVSEEIYTLMRGHAIVRIGNTDVGSIHEGEIFGVLSALTDNTHSADVIAETDVTLMSVPRDEFIQLIQAQPETFMRLLRTLSRHIGELNERLLAALRDSAAGSGHDAG